MSAAAAVEGVDKWAVIVVVSSTRIGRREKASARGVVSIEDVNEEEVAVKVDVDEDECNDIAVGNVAKGVADRASRVVEES